MADQQENPYRPAAEFLGHMVSASLILIVFMGVAFLVGKAAAYLGVHGMDPAFLLVGRGLEWLVYVLDAITWVFRRIVTGHSGIVTARSGAT